MRDITAPSLETASSHGEVDEISGGNFGESWACRLRGAASGDTAPLDDVEAPTRAGGPWLVEYDLAPQRGAAWRQALASRPWTLWRYRELLPTADFAQRVDLGEGATPLCSLRRSAPPGIDLVIKEEGGNPTGSFKDRGLSLAINRARELGVAGVELASAGNAALAACAYAAAAGLAARVALPVDTPPPIRRRCLQSGAEVLESPGTLADAAGRLAAAGGDYLNLSTFREPCRVEGKKTMGFELVEQLGWRYPDWIVYPTGGGTGIVAMHKAFAELEALGLVTGRRPRFVVVQMAGCAPLVRAFARGAESAEPWRDAETRVWGLRVPRSLADFLILRALSETGGVAVTVAEERIAGLRERLIRREGMAFGPEGAAAMVAVEDLVASGQMREGDKVVVFQTGHPANYGL